ncbi:cytochrome b [Sphingomonas xanthus]|uniref:Cytochrome b n=1 Tax=Sphingomonas xanthus TaxID=2594473 RepID=A0A516IU34_9SPHN|nr:cytochrome b/b6 domain-containing protein [Sphingomonas xanthus]QDP20380.1 cytochrome b [Sphingomonas xanthus]
MIASLRRWARKHSARGRYTPVGIWFHWIMAALIIYQLFAGWRMERLPVGVERISAYGDHSAMGLLILLLAALRGVWRLIVPGPINDADTPGWQAEAAHITQILFYLLFAILPISGLIMWSAITPAEPLTLAGLIPVPVLPLESLAMEWKMWILEAAEQVHGIAVIALALLVPIHVAAALKHHFWDHHDVLEGMLPEIPDGHSHPKGAQHRPRPPLSATGPNGG